MRRTQITIFVSIIFGILLLAHAVIYEAVLLIWPTLSAHLIFTRVVTLALPLLFIAANLMSFNFNNFLVRTFYKIMATWIGLVLYLFLASLILGILGIFFKLNYTLAGQILFAIAIAITFFGIVHSQQTQIVKVNVKLPNLPKIWSDRKIVFVSDFHLGHIRGQKFAGNVTQQINKLAPDLVIIGGDLYDGVKVNSSEIIKPLRDIKASLGVYFVTGNHDGFSDASTTEDVAKIAASGITVLQNQIVKIDDLQIIGVGYKQTTEKNAYQELLNNLKIDRKFPSILIKHVPDNINIAADAGISLQVSGHTHRAQVWPFRFLPKLIYKGFDYGLKNFGAMQILTSSGVGTWGPPLRVGTNSEIVLLTLSD